MKDTDQVGINKRQILEVFLRAEDSGGGERLASMCGRIIRNVN